MHGEGELMVKGDTPFYYKGTFMNGNQEGKGVYFHPTWIYIGDFVKGMLHGYGKLIHTAGELKG